jgi:hypothetical protein
MPSTSDPAPRWGLVVTLLLSTAIAVAAQTPPPRDVYAVPAQGAPRDRPPQPRAGTATVRGRVVDGVTGAPLSRARVRLMTGPNGPTAMTDKEGVFTLTRVPAGPLILSTDKATYTTSRYPEVSRSLRARSTPTIVRDGETVEITVKLFHGGVLAGRVLDAYGDPVEYADVRILVVPRGRAPQMRNSTSTNDLGEFRAARLEPGRYVLSVVPRAMGNDMPMGVATDVQPMPTPTFYPPAASAEEAQSIAVNRGESITGIEIVLGEGMPSVITGVVLGPDGPLTNYRGNINVRTVSSDSSGGTHFGGSGLRPDGTFRLPLTPGNYYLEAHMYPQMQPGEQFQPGKELFGTVPITVAGGTTESVTIVVGRGGTATGRVMFDGTSPPPAPPARPVTPPFSNDGSCRMPETTVAADWSFKIEGVSGTCSAPQYNAFGRWAVKSVIIRGQNVTDRSFTFEQGQQYDVQIVVTDRAPELQFHVSGDDGQLTREYVAVVFNVDKAKWKQMGRGVRPFVPRPANLPLNPMGVPPGQTGPTPARDVLTGLRPGEYYAIALDDIESEDVYDPSVLEKLVTQASRVILGEAGTVEVVLPRMKIADLIR